MRTLYIDAAAGMSGNMFMAAALDALREAGHLDAIATWEAAVAALGLDDVDVVQQRVQKHGIGALHIDVQHQEHHPHRGLSDVLGVIDRAALPDAVHARATRMFTLLAEAEAEVHGMSVEQVHFHEVGAVDAIVDVMSAALLLDLLQVERVVCSPVRTGHGEVQCAHGAMPVPAPATARLLLQGIPSFAGETAGEWLTPTGACILAAIVDAWGPQPTMTPTALGVGAGTKDAPHVNAVRFFVGDEAGDAQRARPGVDVEEVVEIKFHVDDMTGEDLGAFTDTLMEGPALDVTVLAGVGKKGRPQHLVEVIAAPQAEDDVLDQVWAHATTFGVRVRRTARLALQRDMHLVQTAFGEVRVKVAVPQAPSAAAHVHAEHDDCARLARAHGVRVGQVRHAAEAAYVDQNRS